MIHIIVGNGRSIETINWIKHVIPNGSILHIETPNILHTETHSLLMRMVSKGVRLQSSPQHPYSSDPTSTLSSPNLYLLALHWFWAKQIKFEGKDKTGAVVLGFLDGNFFWQESDCSYLVQPLLSARERPLSCHVFSSLKKQDLKWDIKGWNQVSFGHQLPLGQKLPHHEWASYKSCSVLEAGDISLPTFRSVKQ